MSNKTPKRLTPSATGQKRAKGEEPGKALQLQLPGQSFESYLAAISQIPILSPEQEKALAIRYYEHEDMDATRHLVLSHLRFVVHIARSYNGYGLPLADLVQEGNVGLLKAVKRFNPYLEVHLVSFAVHWIRAEIHEYILRNWRLVKVATTKAQRKLFFNLRSSKRSHGWMTQDEIERMASDLGVEPRDVREMESRMSAHEASFDLGYNDDEENAYQAPQNQLEDNRYDPGVEMEVEDWRRKSSAGLYQALEQLDDRSRDILTRRWLNENKTSLHQLAEKYGVSAERIRQIEVSAMGKLRKLIHPQHALFPALG